MADGGFDVTHSSCISCVLIGDQYGCADLVAHARCRCKLEQESGLSGGTSALKRSLVLKRKAHVNEKHLQKRGLSQWRGWIQNRWKFHSPNALFATRCASPLRNTRNEKGWKHESADLRVLVHTKPQEFPGQGVGRRGTDARPK